MIDDVIQLQFDVAIVLGIFTFVKNGCNQGRSETIGHRVLAVVGDSAGWTGSNLLPAGFANDVSRTTRGYWNFSGDEEADWTLQ